MLIDIDIVDVINSGCELQENVDTFWLINETSFGTHLVLKAPKIDIEIPIIEKDSIFRVFKYSNKFVVTKSDKINMEVFAVIPTGEQDG